MVVRWTILPISTKQSAITSHLNLLKIKRRLWRMMLEFQVQYLVINIC